VTLNRFGTAHGEIAIPVSARAGQAYVELKLAGEGDEPLERQSFFAVDISSRQPLRRNGTRQRGGPLRPGREIVVRVAAAYLSGGPAVGARVELKCRPVDFHGQIFREQAQMRGSSINGSPRREQNARERNRCVRRAEFPLRLPERIPGQSRCNSRLRWSRMAGRPCKRMPHGRSSLRTGS